MAQKFSIDLTTTPPDIAHELDLIDGIPQNVIDITEEFAKSLLTAVGAALLKNPLSRLTLHSFNADILETKGSFAGSKNDFIRLLTKTFEERLSRHANSTASCMSIKDFHKKMKLARLSTYPEWRETWKVLSTTYQKEISAVAVQTGALVLQEEASVCRIQQQTIDSIPDEDLINAFEKWLHQRDLKLITELTFDEYQGSALLDILSLFPSLRKVTVINCPNLIRLHKTVEYSNLTHLYVKNCPQLELDTLALSKKKITALRNL